MILEGASGEKCEELPINVALNAIFSKYSIHPLRNINFGPLQYGDNRTRTFEIRNEGIFDFEFTVSELVDERQRMDKTQRKSSPKEEQKFKPRETAIVKKPPIDPKKVPKAKEAQWILASLLYLQALGLCQSRILLWFLSLLMLKGQNCIRKHLRLIFLIEIL